MVSDDRNGFNDGGMMDNGGAVGDGSRGGLDEDRRAVNHRSVDGVDNGSSVDGLNDNRGSVHYGSMHGVNDRRVNGVDNRSAMVNDLRRLGNGGLGCDYGNSVGVDHWRCVDRGHEGG